jgi:hypothetical protein
MSNNEDEKKDALRQLDEKHGVNQTAPVEEPVQETKEVNPTALGKAQTYIDPELSGAAESHWKRLPLELLPSKGNFYPDNSELLIRSASADEIRHWSTIDEYDRLSIREMLDFILNSCMSFKIKGQPITFSSKNLCEIDKFYIIFRIHELTFPNGENQLSTLFACTKGCKTGEQFSERRPIVSSMLRVYELPNEVMKYYSSADKCFVIESKKLQETFPLFMPISGVSDAIRNYRQRGSYEKAFLDLLPYLTNDPREITRAGMQKFYQYYKTWPDNKFFFISQFKDLLKKGKRKDLEIACPKCGEQITVPIFSSNSFVVKDLFFVSGRLDDLI